MVRSFDECGEISEIETTIVVEKINVDGDSDAREAVDSPQRGLRQRADPSFS